MMARVSPKHVRDVVPCPECGAQIGSLCIRHTANATYPVNEYIHEARYKLYGEYVGTSKPEVRVKRMWEVRCDHHGVIAQRFTKKEALSVKVKHATQCEAWAFPGLQKQATP